MSRWLLLNRALWLVVALGVLWLSHASFRFSHYVGRNWWKALFRKKTVMTELPVTAPIAVPQVHGEFNRNTKVYQLLQLSWQSFWDNILGWGWIAKLALVGLLMIMGPELLEGPLGVPRTPSTGRVIPIFSFFPVKMTVVTLITIYM